MTKLPALLLALAFALANMGGTIAGLTYLASSSDPSVPHVLIDDIDPGDDPGDPSDDSDGDEDSSSPELDEDDVKHFGVVSFVARPPSGRRAGATAADDLAFQHVHLDGLERPPRA